MSNGKFSSTKTPIYRKKFKNKYESKLKNKLKNVIKFKYLNQNIIFKFKFSLYY